MSKFIDLTGMVINNWQVVQRLPYHSHQVYWNCTCLGCGNTYQIGGSSLRKNKSTQCRGCCDTKKRMGGIGGIVWNRIKSHAKQKNYDLTVTSDHLWQLLINQNFRCALSGLPLTVQGNKRRESSITASLDRIDSQKGYVNGNVQWVHKYINKMKGTLKQDQFIELCKEVSQCMTN